MALLWPVTRWLKWELPPGGASEHQRPVAWVETRARRDMR
jgi:hypothetical protein